VGDETRAASREREGRGADVDAVDDRAGRVDGEVRSGPDADFQDIASGAADDTGARMAEAEAISPGASPGRASGLSERPRPAGARRRSGERGTGCPTGSPAPSGWPPPSARAGDACRTAPATLIRAGRTPRRPVRRHTPQPHPRSMRPAGAPRPSPSVRGRPRRPRSD
jgi:hypothetical protein